MKGAILAVETSCDETAAAVYQADRGILSSVLFSQIAQHQKFGGVVPEVAARAHLERISLIVQQALDEADIALTDITALGVTCKPGLAGALLVGLCFTKALAWSVHKPFVGINHLEGHIFSSFLEQSVPFPHICITASGGHTSLYLVHDFGRYELLGETQDDAAGEAFDKVAKLMHLSYPGGPIIERLAAQVNFQDFFHYPRSTKHSLQFSFSGLKTAVLYDLVRRNAYNLTEKKFLKPEDTLLKQQVSSSLLVCIADIFEQKVAHAFQKYPTIKALTFVGGVACNAYIRKRLSLWCTNAGISFFYPRAKYCTDNAAMIAFVADYKIRNGESSGFDLDIF